MSLLTEDEIVKVGRHKLTHDMGMCTCPCFDALMAIAERLPEHERGLKLDGLLAGLGALSGPVADGDVPGGGETDADWKADRAANPRDDCSAATSNDHEADGA